MNVEHTEKLVSAKDIASTGTDVRKLSSLEQLESLGDGKAVQVKGDFADGECLS